MDNTNDIEYLKREIEKLKKEKEALEQQHISFKVSEKKGLSVYGLQRFPVTLYKKQWLILLDTADDIRSFIEAHNEELI